MFHHSIYCLFLLFGLIYNLSLPLCLFIFFSFVFCGFHWALKAGMDRYSLLEASIRKADFVRNTARITGKKNVEGRVLEIKPFHLTKAAIKVN